MPVTRQHLLDNMEQEWGVIVEWLHMHALPQ
jgi:hypothetical protein